MSSARLGCGWACPHYTAEIEYAPDMCPNTLDIPMTARLAPNFELAAAVMTDVRGDEERGARDEFFRVLREELSTR